MFQLLTLKMCFFTEYSFFFQAQIKSNKNETFQKNVLGTIQDDLRSSCTNTLTLFLLSFLYKHRISSMILIFSLSLVLALKLTINFRYMINFWYIGCSGSVDYFSTCLF